MDGKAGKQCQAPQLGEVKGRGLQGGALRANADSTGSCLVSLHSCCPRPPVEPCTARQAFVPEKCTTRSFITAKTSEHCLTALGLQGWAHGVSQISVNA